MTQYREVLRLYGQGISQRSIALSCECSRNTIARVIARAKELDIKWPLSSEVTDTDLDKLFFSREPVESVRKYPDVEYIHKELMRNGVSLKLLWNEYCEECRQSNEIPLM